MASVAQRLANYDGIGSIDIALVEGVNAAEMARELQEEQGVFTDVMTETLARELSRRRQRRLEAEWCPDADPPSVARELERGPLDELKALSALVRVQMVRVDRALAIEQRNGRIQKDAGREILAASKMLGELARLKVLLGVYPVSNEPAVLSDFAGLSEETAEVLSRPESRHRVLSIIDRVATRGQLKFDR